MPDKPTDTSLAAVYYGPRQIKLERLPTPKLAAGEILVRVAGCTICGSDIHSYEGRRHVPQPSILGHEIVGQIVEFGADAERLDLAGHELSLGDHVSWAVVANCGTCFYCQHDLPQKCVSAVKYGHEAFTSDRQLLGGLAEHCVLVSGTRMVRWPDNFPLAIACPASCATATSMAAIDAARDIAGELAGKCIAILGAGMLGLTTCAMAQVAGASHVFCIDPVEERRELALRFGATRATGLESARQELLDRTDGRGADLVIEMSGAPAACEFALSACRIGGAAVMIGSVFPSPPLPVAMEQIVRRCLRIAGVHNYAPKHLLAAANFLIEHGQRFPFAELVTGWHSLEEIETALASRAIRTGVSFHHSEDQPR